jgi:hypothetical protein
VTFLSTPPGTFGPGDFGPDSFGGSDCPDLVEAVRPRIVADEPAPDTSKPWQGRDGLYYRRHQGRLQTMGPYGEDWKDAVDKHADRVTENAKIKHAKPRVSLLYAFGEALIAVAEVLTDGARKYADDSWKREPFSKQDYLDADGRHTFAIGNGELRDPESGRLHAAHKATDSLMYLWHVIKENGSR